MRLQSKHNKMTYLKGKATDRKGAGMELALLVLFVVFACSTLLVTSALRGKQDLQRQESRMVQRLQLDQLAEQAIKDPDVTHESYAIVRDDITNTITITDDKGTALLTVSWDDAGVITQWQYH